MVTTLLGVLSVTDELFWRLPDGYARCGSSLRCLECASLIRNVRDDVKLHSNFHAELRRSGK